MYLELAESPAPETVKEIEEIYLQVPDVVTGETVLIREDVFDALTDREWAMTMKFLEAFQDPDLEGVEPEEQHLSGWMKQMRETRRSNRKQRIDEKMKRREDRRKWREQKRESRLGKMEARRQNILARADIKRGRAQVQEEKAGAIGRGEWQPSRPGDVIKGIVGDVANAAGKIFGGGDELDPAMYPIAPDYEDKKILGMPPALAIGLGVVVAGGIVYFISQKK